MFLFCNKAFLMMTNFFLWAGKASPTNAHINIFFTMCIKQGGRGALGPYARIKTHLRRTSTWELSGRLLFLLSVPSSSSALKEEKSPSLLATTALTWKETRRGIWHEWASPQFPAEYLCWWRMMTSVSYSNTKPCLVNRLNDAGVKTTPTINQRF